MRYFPAQRGVETGTALLDVSKVKSGRVRDRLDMIVAGKIGIGSIVEIIIVSGNRGNVIQCQRLWKGSAKIRVGRTAVAYVPAGVYVEVHQVGEPFAC